MISATCWIPRGAAAENPQKVELDEAEMARISALAKMELAEAKEELHPEVADDHPPATSNAENDDLAEYKMEDYDNELEEDKRNTIWNVQSLAYYKPDEQDEYLTLPSAQDDEEEDEDLKILPTDNLILATKTEDEHSLLEVHVYDDKEGSLYVHHDILLPSFPLCVEWVPIVPSNGPAQGPVKPGNFVAIGTFEPEIELWNLDKVEGIYPAAILGMADRLEAKAVGTGKKKRKVKDPNSKYHVDAVLALASNPNQANLLASASADTTIKLWDLHSASSSTEQAAQSFENYHKGKVSSLAWNPTDATVLLSGGYDKCARVGDVRSANIAKDSYTFDTKSDVEGVAWAADGVHFFAGTDSGNIFKFDARQTSKPVWVLQAHDSEVTSFCTNPYITDLLVSASSDHKVKMWNIQNDKPSMLLSRDFDVGKVFSVNFGPEQATKSLLSVAGSEGSLKVWDAFSNRVVRSAFGGEKREGEGERLAVVNDDNDEESEDEDVEEVAEMGDE